MRYKGDKFGKYFKADKMGAWGCLFAFILSFLIVLSFYFLLKKIGVDFWFIFLFPLVFLFAFFIELVKEQAEKQKEKEMREAVLESNITDTDNMTGEEFEKYCKALFENLGYEVFLTKKTADYGADLILNFQDEESIGQCKRYSNKISVSAIQEITAAKEYYQVKKAFVITNNYFTENAKNLANANNVMLIDRNKLIDLIIEAKNKEV